jgi:cysteine synthase
VLQKLFHIEEHPLPNFKEKEVERSLSQVYQDPVFQAFDPKNRQFMIARWLPSTLNRFGRGYDIRMAALIPFIFPHIKTVPTFQMMLEDFRGGLYKGKHTIVVDSSGNTAHAVIRLAQAFGFSKVIVVTSTDAPDSKIGILKAFGDFADVQQVSKPEETARELGQKPGHYHLNQYAHEGNMHAHWMYTAPEIVRVLGGDASQIGVIAIAMGSGGTVAGVGSYFKLGDAKETTIVGVRPSPGEQVPGARNAKKMEIVKLPWSAVVDDIVEINRKQSFIGMRELWNVIEPQPGPTSGLAYVGLVRHLIEMGDKKREALRGKCVAFICPDDGRFYSDVIRAELDSNQGL